ncbi:hypothetical protein [Hydrogenothermus marinus]|uniref:Uncharacterized protein n=1 Tax=Hydrogenothermus marinus TaxID=133270 RepID=A0A3M0BJL3_9AQUI|nr:hypothetical protein [Hydrogenothermus marinus]RMA97520.1 hypothetical protein CLV39_0133 [Hydrogenothermus marinus]
MKDEIFVNFELFIDQKDLKSENLEEGKTIEINPKKIFITVNKVPFYECDIRNYDDILIGRIKKIFDLGESLDIKENVFQKE